MDIQSGTGELKMRRRLVVVIQSGWIVFVFVVIRGKEGEAEDRIIQYVN